MDKNDLIVSFEDGAKTIRRTVASVPDAAFDFMPVKADDWTIRQHIIHLADSETNNFIRIKSCVAQPASNGFVIDECAWVRNLDNRKECVEDYLDLFTLLRKIMGSFLRTVPEDDFRDRYFVRTYNGETGRVTLGEAVEMYCNHVDFHVEYIEKILAEYAGNCS